MIFGERPLPECEGALLAHGMVLAGLRHGKGEVIDRALLAAAREAGLDRLWVARLEAGDLAEGPAAAAIGKALAGSGIDVAAPVMGRVHLKAAHAGLLWFDPAAVQALNAATDSVAVATLPPATPVEKGTLVASVKIVPYALSPADVAALALESVRPLAVRPWRAGAEALLLQTRLPETTDKLLEKAVDVTKERLAALGIALRRGPLLAHEVAPLATALGAAIRARPPLLLVAGATVASDRGDVIPAAILAAGGTLVRVGMPVDPGNMLVVGRFSDTLVLGLPGCVRSPKRNGLDLVLEHWAAGLDVSAGLLAAMGVGGLLQESGHPVPWGWAGG